MVTAATLVTLVFIDALAIRSQRDLSPLAPEGTVVATLNAGIPFGRNEHALPPKVDAAVIAIEASETGRFHLPLHLLAGGSQQSTLDSYFGQLHLVAVFAEGFRGCYGRFSGFLCRLFRN